MGNKLRYPFFIGLLLLSLLSVVAFILFHPHFEKVWAQYPDCDCGRCATLYCAENCPGEMMCLWGENDACECCSDCGGGACFTGDTPIRMADNTEKPISEVKEGEIVKSFDPETGEITDSEMTKVYKHSKEEIKGYYLLTLESGKQIKVTPEHPILVLDEKGERVWRTAEEIVIGDYALVYDESGDIVQKTDSTEEAETVLDQQQSQPPSNPSLLQVLFPPLWLFMKMFKN